VGQFITGCDTRNKMEGIEFLEAKQSEHGEIIDFMNEHFIPHEPLNIAIHLCEAGYRETLFLYKYI
jgi:hypothetical protein